MFRHFYLNSEKISLDIVNEFKNKLAVCKIEKDTPDSLLFLAWQ